MTQAWGNLVKVAVSSVAGGGTGAITLGSAATNYLTFATAGIADGQAVTYTVVRASDGAKQVNTGIYTASGTTLTQNYIVSTTGSQFNVSAGDAVEIVGIAEQMINPIITPQGRLTLVSGTPVMTGDQTAKGTVYYTPCFGALIPIWDGTVWRSRVFGELTLTLNSTDNVSGSIYDIFVFNNLGTLTLGTGPAWTSTSARGTGAGTTQLSQLNGLWVNTVSITLRANGSSLGAQAANACTYVGSIYCTANGQTGIQFTPAAAGGGSNTRVALYNAYNRQRRTFRSQDNNGGWGVTSSTWAMLDAGGTGSGANNRVSYLDGLAQSPVEGVCGGYLFMDTSCQGAIGMLLNATSGQPACPAISAQTGAFVIGWVQSNENFAPTMGWNYVQAMQCNITNAHTVTIGGNSGSNNWQTLLVSLEN